MAAPVGLAGAAVVSWSLPETHGRPCWPALPHGLGRGLCTEAAGGGGDPTARAALGFPATETSSVAGVDVGRTSGRPNSHPWE